MEALDKELSSVLELLMTLPPGNDHHPDVMWLYSWLIQHERSVQDFIYILGPLQKHLTHVITTQTIPLVERNASNEDNVCKNFGLWSSHASDLSRDIVSPPPNPIYLARVASEALAVRCPMLEGQWEIVIGQLHEIFQSYSYSSVTELYGPASTVFSNWLISVGSDSYMSISPVLRCNMISLYMLLKIDEGNFEQALSSLMFACSFIDRLSTSVKERTYTKKLWETIIFCFALLNKDTYLKQFDVRIANKIRLHRDIRKRNRLHDFSHEYAIGLKTVSQPREIQILHVLLRAASEEARIDCHIFPSFEDSCIRLFHILWYFKKTLKEPELISVTAETFMDVLKALFSVTEEQHIPNNTEEERDVWKQFLHIIMGASLRISYPLLKYFTNGRFIGKTPIGEEIIRRYSGEISKMRSLITEKLRDTLKMDAPMIYDLVYNDEY